MLMYSSCLTKEDICENFFTALRDQREYGFYATGWVKAYGTAYEAWPVSTQGTPCDVDSIMHYVSAQGANRKCALDSVVDECPLVKYKEPGNPGAGVEMIERHYGLLLGM
jgi:hypothetical protein